MKMQDDQIRELFQQKLSGHESAVDPALWNSIQSGIAGQTGTVATAVAKTSMLKIASIITGIVLTGTITGYYLLSKPTNSENFISSNKQVTITETPQVSPELDGSKEIFQERSTNNQSSLIEKQTQKGNWPNISTADPFLVISGEQKDSLPTPEIPIVTKTGYPDFPAKLDEQPNQQESKNEDFTTQFSVVGPADMALTKMLIPEYTKAHTYKWTINHGEAVYNELSSTHEFSTSGENHIRLDIEKTAGSGFTEFSEKTICVCDRAEVVIEYDLFTPNGDNYSKVFDPMIDSRNIIPIRLLIIDKSSGIQVYEGLNDDAKWNGKGAFGQDFPAGQYFYQFSATDLCGKKLVDKTGFIRLER